MEQERARRMFAFGVFLTAIGVLSEIGVLRHGNASGAACLNFFLSLLSSSGLDCFVSRHDSTPIGIKESLQGEYMKSDDGSPFSSRRGDILE